MCYDADLGKSWHLHGLKMGVSQRNGMKSKLGDVWKAKDLNDATSTVVPAHLELGTYDLNDAKITILDSVFKMV